MIAYPLFMALEGRQSLLKPREYSSNIILLEKSDLSIAIEAKGILPSISF